MLDMKVSFIVIIDYRVIFCSVYVFSTLGFVDTLHSFCSYRRLDHRVSPLLSDLISILHPSSDVDRSQHSWRTVCILFWSDCMCLTMVIDPESKTDTCHIC